MAKRYTALTLIFLCLSAQSFAEIGAVVNDFPAPGGNSTGLTWDGRYLWIADTGTDKIYQLESNLGQIRYTIPAPAGATVNGLAWDGEYLWCSDNENNRLYQIDVADSSVLRMVDCPSQTPRGMTYDGEFLWYQDSENRRLYAFDPVSGSFVDSLDSPSGYNRGLAWDGTYLWSTDRNLNELYMLDPRRGAVITIVRAPGTYSYGLTYDGEYLWHTDYETNRIYKIQAHGPEKYNLLDPLKATIRYSVNISNAGSTTMDLQTYMACPKNSPYQNLDSPLQFLNEPHEYFDDTFGQKIAYYREDLSPGSQRVYEWTTAATLYNIRYFLRPDSVGSLDDIPLEITATYTADAEKFDITHPLIANAAAEAIDGETNLYWQVRSIHDYVFTHIEYVNDGRWDSAPQVLSQGHGSCSEYSYLFIALCRAIGIPARFEAGGHLRDTIPYEDTVFHRWQQVYFPNFGWVPIDCTWDDKEYPANQARYFGAASNHAFTTTIVGGGTRGMWWTYNSANENSGGLRQREKIMHWLPYTTDVEVEIASTPQEHILCSNYPNPFNSGTMLRYRLPRTEPVTIRLFDGRGRLLRTFAQPSRTEGAITWDGTDGNGIAVPSGVYYYLVESENQKARGRLVLVR